MSKQGGIHFPGLNGLRAIAAMAVVVSHITLSLKDFNLNPYLFGKLNDGTPKGLALAGYGVSIFFVLSGFLITYLLQVEKEVKGINIRKFYMRRILRIWPLYYLYLFITVFVLLAAGFRVRFDSLVFYLFYAANVPFILGTALELLGHYWSLGVEEQFYIFWPWVNKKVKNLVPLLIIAAGGLIVLKVIVHLISPLSVLASVIHVTRFHCMMIGALGAVLYKQQHRIFMALTDNKITQLLSWIVIGLAAVNKFSVASIIDNEIVAVFSLCLIIGQIGKKNRIINLESGVFDFPGKISYGIYVIHPLLIYLFSRLAGNIVLAAPLKYALIYTVITAVTLGLAYISYTWFESYFLKLKQKYVIVKSSATKNPELAGN